MEYDKMLDNLYKQLPEKAKEKSRFTMPVFESFVEGVNTIIPNFTEVTNTLRREPEHLMKYLSKECATAATPDQKRLVLKGKFRTKQLNEKLEHYIKDYVLCKECGKPDTNIVEQERQLWLRCEACGARKPISIIK